MMWHRGLWVGNTMPGEGGGGRFPGDGPRPRRVRAARRVTVGVLGEPGG